MLIQAAQKAGIATEDLSTAWSQDAVRYTHNGKSEVVLEGVLLGSTSVLTQTICNDLPVARQVLRLLNLPTPTERVFKVDAGQPARGQIAAATEGFWEQGKTYRCLPAFGAEGHDIASNLRSIDNLEMHLDQFSDDYETWTLEEQVEGLDLQILAMGGRLVSGIVRSALQLEGDGARTLEEMIESYNASASDADRITIDADTRQLLRDQSIYLSEVVPAGRKVQVKNPGAGGGAQDVTNSLHADYASWVKRILDVVDAPVLGLSLKVASPEAAPQGSAWIISMNSKPDWLGFQTAQGCNTDIARLLLAQIFGEF